MPRDNSRRKTRREAVDPRPNDQPQLRPQRRFLTGGGFDEGVRLARALERAFGVTTDFTINNQLRRNAEGAKLAVTEAGAGRSRDESNRQAGYNRAWDELDAEYDFNLIKKELPEQLRGFNAEERTEAEVQGFVDKYFESQFGGIENLGDSAYAKYLGPRLQAFEQEIIGSHREAQLQRIQEDQRSKVFANARDALADTGQLDYKSLFERTGTFFEGADKKTVFWETVYDLAIESGQPDLIRNVPEKFGGVVSGIRDPALQDSHRTAIAAAERQQAVLAAAEQQAERDASERCILDLQLLIAQKTFRGESTVAELELLRNEPEATLSDFTAAINFGQSQLGEFESRSADVDFKAAMWNQIYDGTAGLPAVMEAYSNGLLGGGEQAASELQQMMSTAQQMNQQSSRFSSEQVTTWRSALNRRYNAKLGGPLAAEIVTIESMKRIATGESSYADVFGGVHPGIVNLRVIEELSDGSISEDEAFAVLQYIN